VYLGPGGHSTTLSQAGGLVTQNGIVNHLRVFADANLGTTETAIFTVNVAGVDTGITATVTGNGQISNDASHYALISPGNLITVKCVASTGAASFRAAATVGVLPVSS
jgi:hypothetical protein